MLHNALLTACGLEPVPQRDKMIMGGGIFLTSVFQIVSGELLFEGTWKNEIVDRGDMASPKDTTLIKASLLHLGTFSSL